MRYVCSALVVVMLSGITVAQQHPAHNQPQPATLMSGLGDLHHPVSTSNPEAQKFFDSGIAPDLRFQPRRGCAFIWSRC